MKKTRRRMIWFICSIFLMGMIAFVIIGFCQTDLEVTHYEYSSSKVPSEFDGYKIVQISDLHHKNFGRNQSELIQAIQEEEPDLILLTGDIVDKNHTDMAPVENLIKGISSLAPVYYVTGNHELDMGAVKQYDALEMLFQQYGIVDLDDRSVEIKQGEASIYVHGQKFRSYYITDYLPLADESKFNILLYHCSDYFDLINDYGYDIIFSGHSHGGIVRLPFVGGVFGNSGDFFPDYAGGTYTENGCTLFASRGLGDAKIPRFYNPPEVVSVTLKSQS